MYDEISSNSKFSSLFLKKLIATKLQISTNILNARKAKGLTQQQMADLLEENRSTYAEWEHGTIPRADILAKIATITGVSWGELLGIDENPSAEEKPAHENPLEQILPLGELKVTLKDYVDLITSQNHKAEKEKEEYLALIGNQINLIREVLAPIGNTSIAILNYQKAWVDFFSEVHAKGDKKEEERLIRRMNNIVDGKASGGVLAGMDPAAGKLSKKKKP